MLFYFFSTGYLPLQELHNTCKRFNVPAKHDLLEAVLQKVERNDRNEANYEQFLQLLNWRDSPGESSRDRSGEVTDSWREGTVVYCKWPSNGKLQRFQFAFI